MLRGKADKFAVHGLEADQIELGFEPEMPELALEFEGFRLNIS